MKMYFFNDGKGQQGPLNFDELLTKNITTDTPIWSEGMDKWTTAGQLDEFKDIFLKATIPVVEDTAETNLTDSLKNSSEAKAEVIEPVVPVTELPETISQPLVSAEQTTTPVVPTEVKITESVTETKKSVTAPVQTVANVASETIVNSSPAKPNLVSKKSTAWVSWIFGLLVIGGVGYFIYEDIEKNKNNTVSKEYGVSLTDSASVEPVNTTESGLTSESSNTETINDTVSNEPIVVEPVITEPLKPTNSQVNTKPEEVEKAKVAAKAKAAADVKKKQDAAIAAQNAKEKEMRNNWTKYVTFGNIVYTPKDDGIDGFNVPVYNGTNAVLDKVTIRVDYLKREGKVIKSETIVVNNIPPGSGVNGKAPSNKKARKVNTYITGIYSKKLHFCFPQNNGNEKDPYFCN
ncbi:MAG: DUF4339 domain-containing protein [Chitinophagaceae bacterium]